MASRAVSQDVWIARVHLIARDGCHPFPSPAAIGAYTNCITEARDEIEFKGKVRALLGDEGFDATEFEDLEKLADRLVAATSPEDQSALRDIMDLIAEADLKYEVATTQIHTYSEGHGPH